MFVMLAQCEFLITRIRPHSLKKYTHGKHIIASGKKLLENYRKSAVTQFRDPPRDSVFFRFFVL